MTAVMIDSEHLGSVEVDESSVIELPAGILGFPEQRRYAVVAADDSGMYSWLQSLDEPDLAFLTVVPSPFFPDYEPVISDEDCATIGLTDPEDAQLLCLVTVGDEVVTANLLGPVVLNVRTRLARQVVLTDSSLSTRAPILGG
jgi:flagellar assembly factor FliW